MSTARQLIENIFDNIGISEGDSEKIARALHLLTVDQYTETERFIFELLQNADDLPNQNQPVEVIFVFLPNHLLVLHNGQAFNDSNVVAICNISKSTKSNDLEQTGYKGIGFKSVFLDSKCVYINSGEFSFKFDQNYTEHKFEKEKTPWQIKPIWVDQQQYPQEIQTYADFFQYPVSTALTVSKEKIGEYKSKIKKLFEDPRIILFLRHVTSIQVRGLTNFNRNDIAIKKIKQGDCYQINSNGTITNWLVQDFKFEVPQKLRDDMENDRKVPEKLKSVQQSKVSFAAQIVNNQLLGVSKNQSILFTYLPTNVQDYQFPFLVNADFLTIANRQSIHIDNKWNGFIFEKIGYFIFEWIAQLANHEKYRDFITAIIPLKFTTPQTLLQQEFNKGFDRAIQNIAFIPSEDGNRLLKTSEAIVDETEIIKIVSPKTLLSYLQVNRNFVLTSLQNKQKIKNIEVFTTKTLADFLKKSEEFRKDLESAPDFNFKLINHIFSHDLKTEELISVDFILDEDGFLQQPQTLYFQISQQEKQSLSFTKIPFLHPEIDIKIKRNQEIYSWVNESLKIKNFSGLSFLRQRIRQNHLTPDSNSVDDFIAYTRFIFKYRKELTQQELLKLGALPLLYQDSKNKYYHISANQCHLSDFYSQMSIEPLAKIIGIDRFKFIISNYYQNSDQVQEWEGFFKSIGVIILDRLGILRTVIIPMIKAKEVNEKNTLVLTRFIFEVSLHQPLNDEDIIHLINLPLSTNNGLKAACQCQILADTQPLAANSSLTNISSLNILSSAYYQNLEKVPQFNRFLSNIGVQCLNEIDIIKNKINQFVDNPQLITAANAISIGREIFNYRNQLTENEFKQLSNLNLLLKDGKSLAKANLCYLPQEYRPAQNLELIYQGTGFSNFVSPLYPEANELEEWKKFLHQIGAAEKIKLAMFYPDQKFTLKDNRSDEKLTLYIKSLKEINPNYTHISNWLYILDGKYFSNYNYAIQMWSYINNDWKTLNINKKSILWQNETKLGEVPSFFEFYIRENPSIPCTDNTCHAPYKGVYSNSLNTVIADCYPVFALGINSEIESFFGIKQSLNLETFLVILEDIAKKYPNERIDQLKRYNETISLLNYCLRKGVTEDEQQKVQEWSKNKGKLLAHNDQFVSIDKLFYLNPGFDLPPKNNKNLINLQKSILESDDIQNLFSIFGIQPMTKDDMKVVAVNEQPDEILLNLIKERAILIDIFLNQSSYNNLQEFICNRVHQVKFCKADKILLKIDKIDYQESIPNHYDEPNFSLHYVKRWNSIKNVKIGDLLLKLLGLSSSKINSQILLRLLDDEIEDVIEYLREHDCDLSRLPKKLLVSVSEDLEESNIFDSQRQVEKESTIPDQSKVRSPDGTGDPDTGIWGEEQARLFYESLGYKVKKEDDFSRVGFDFTCIKILPSSKVKRVYSEVKTISYETPIIRLKEYQWKCMQSDKQDYYELLIVVHRSKTIIEIIQINPLLAVLNRQLRSLYALSKTDEEYKRNVEVLIGFQQNEKGDSQEILINWQRLFKSIKDLGIKIHPQGIPKE